MSKQDIIYKKLKKLVMLKASETGIIYARIPGYVRILGTNVYVFFIKIIAALSIKDPN